MLKIGKQSYDPQKIFLPYTPEFYLPCEVYPLALGHLLDFVEISVSYDFTNQQEIFSFSHWNKQKKQGDIVYLSLAK